jgi:hypothetical protein
MTWSIFELHTAFAIRKNKKWISIISVDYKRPKSDTRLFTRASTIMGKKIVFDYGGQSGYVLFGCRFG